MLFEDDAEMVFEAWRSHRPNPAYCRLTAGRRKLISTRLRIFSAHALCALIRYAFEANTSEARFWRGDNPQKQDYTGLTNLFRVTKMDDRIERACLWIDDQPTGEVEEGIDLGPMGAWS